MAQNDGAHGHQSRHWLVLEALYDALKRAYGAAVKKEPTAYRDYSDTRPDLTLQRDGLRAMDLKVLDPIGSVAGEVQHRGAFVGLGNTHEEARELVVGRLQRGAEGDGTFKRTTGAGYVAPKAGAYARAQANGVDCAALLVRRLRAGAPRALARRGGVQVQQVERGGVRRDDVERADVADFRDAARERCSAQGGGQRGERCAWPVCRRRPARGAARLRGPGVGSVRLLLGLVGE